MDLDELDRCIGQGENLHTEFKSRSAHTDDLAATLVAFANTDGGQLLFGVSDDGQAQGVGDPDSAMQRMDQIAQQNCEPSLTIIQESVKTAGDEAVIVVNVPQGDQRPYRTNRGDYFIRTTSGRRRASRQELLRLFQAAESLYYDETLVLRASLEDVDRYLFEHFLTQAYQRPLEDFQIGYQALLQNLGLVRQQKQVLYPTVAALLFLGRDPQRFLPNAHVVAARIPGNDLAAVPSDVKKIEGRLPDVLESADRFLYIHLPIAHEIHGLEPENRPELPREALRELLVNALAHRDYTVAAPVRVFVFDDRVEIRTPGGLPNSVTVEAVRLGAAHVLRNPTIYTLFSRYGLVTGVGSGVYRAIQQVRAITGRELTLSLEGNEFVVTIPRPPKSQ
jgi:ATP-dependent DNA helicase RecG